MRERRLLHYGLVLFPAVLLCVLMLNIAGIKAEASTNGHSQAEAVNWIQDRENEGWAENYDHVGPSKPQCVDLIQCYLDWLGASSLKGGNACSYINKDVASVGWSYQSSPQPGDIAVWDAYVLGASDPYGVGHVALVKSVNGSSFNLVEVNGNTGLPGKRSCSIYGPTTYIHPDFTSNNKPLITLDGYSCTDGKVVVKGWAYDPDEPTKVIDVHVYLYNGGDAYCIGGTTADKKRDDVDAFYHCGAYHGFYAEFYPTIGGNLDVEVVALDSAGGAPNWNGRRAISIPIDKTPPVISNIEITNVTASGYTITCDVSDNVAVKRVAFPTWTENNDQDDIIWHEGVIKDGKASFTVLKKDHKNETNCKYITHIYAYDYMGNVSSEPSSVIMQEPARDAVLPDGDYIIAFAGNSDKTSFYFLDIQGEEQPAKSANVSVYNRGASAEIPECDVWTIKYSKGFYTICQKRKSGETGKDAALDVQGASTEDAANVMVSEYHGRDNQLWSITHNDNDGYRIQTKCSGNSLDLYGAVPSNGANVVVCTNNNTIAQSWLFIPYIPTQPIDNGKYVITSALDSSKVISIEGNEKDYDPSSEASITVAEDTNIQLGNDTFSNKYNEFEFVKLENGYYKIKHVASGKALDLQYGTSTLKTNIALHTDNCSYTQQWAVIANDNGYYFVPRASGMALNVEGSKTAVGTNISSWYVNNSRAQSWTFVPAEYMVSYDVNGGVGTVSAQKKYYRNDVIITDVLPTKEGSEFLGWSENKNAEVAEYISGNHFTKDQNTTLYAVWKKEVVIPEVKDLALEENADGVKLLWTAVEGVAKYRIMRKADDETSFTALAKISNTTYVDKTVKAGKTYTYTIRCMDDAGKYVGNYDAVGKSIQVSVKLQAEIALENTSSGIRLSWDAVDGAAKYRVMRKAEGESDFTALAKIAGTSYVDKTVEAGKTYTYTVRCMDDAGKYFGSYDTTGKSIKYEAKIEAEFTVESTAEGIKVSWNALNGAAKYRVMRKAEGESGFSSLAKVTGTSYIDKTVEAGKTYTYTVRCMNEEGKYIGSYDTVGKSATVTALIKAEFTVSNAANGVQISWNPVDGVAKYRVMRKAEGESTFTALAKISGTTYIDKTAEAGKTYTYTVRCMNGSGQYVGVYDTVGKSIEVPFNEAEEVSEEEMSCEEIPEEELSVEESFTEESVEEESEEASADETE